MNTTQTSQLDAILASLTREVAALDGAIEQVDAAEVSRV